MGDEKCPIIEAICCSLYWYMFTACDTCLKEKWTVTQLLLYKFTQFKVVLNLYNVKMYQERYEFARTSVPTI